MQPDTPPTHTHEPCAAPPLVQFQTTEEGYANLNAVV